MHSRLICFRGSHRLQSSWFSLTALAGTFFSVWLILWITPLLSRWYGLIHLLWTPNISVKYWKVLVWGLAPRPAPPSVCLVKSWPSIVVNTALHTSKNFYSDPPCPHTITFSSTVPLHILWSSCFLVVVFRMSWLHLSTLDTKLHGRQSCSTVVFPFALIPMVQEAIH